MAARENLPHQVSVLYETYKFLADEGDVNRAAFKAKLLTMMTRMEDGAEVNAVDFEGSRTMAEILYPVEVVMDALRAVIAYIDLDGSPANPPPNPRATFTDFAGCRVET